MWSILYEVGLQVGEWHACVRTVRCYACVRWLFHGADAESYAAAYQLRTRHHYDRRCPYLDADRHYCTRHNRHQLAEYLLRGNESGLVLDGARVSVSPTGTDY